MPFVGRSAELAVLEQAWAAVEAGRRQVVFIGGEPGAGKTRLVAELAAAVEAQDAAVLYGTSFSDFGVPYQPFVECLEHLMADPAFDLSLPESAMPLARLTPTIERRLGGIPEAGLRDDRRELFGAFRDVLQRLADEKPLALVLEDLHWAQEPTRQLLSYLVQSTESDRILLVATHRSTPPDRSDEYTETVAMLYRLGGVHRIDLAGLEVTDITHVVMVSAAMDLSEARRSAAVLRDRTGGNPFFIRELLNHGGQETTPATVLDAIRVRLNHFSDDVRRAVELAATVGDIFDQDLLIAAVGEPTTVLAGIDEMLNAGLVVARPDSPGRYEFRHALTRQAVLGSMAPSLRTQAHAEIAKAVNEWQPAGPQRESLLAFHYGQASSLGYESEAALHSVAAAKQAEKTLAYEDAADWYRQAADFGGAANRNHYLLDAAKNLVAAAAYDQAIEIYASLVDADDPQVAAMATLGYEDASWRPGHDPGKTVGYIDQVLSRIDHDPADAVYIRLIGAKARALVYSGEDSFELSDRAIAMARELGDEETLAAVLISSINQVGDPHHIEVKMARALEILDWAERTGTPEATAHAASYLGSFSYILGDAHTRAEAHRIQLEAVEQGGLTLWKWLSGCRVYVGHLIAGDLDLARSQALSLLEMGAEFGTEVTGPFGFQMFMVEREAGRLESVRHVLEDERISGAYWGPGLLALYVELGELDRAREIIDDVSTAESAKPRSSADWPGVIALLAEAVIALDDVELAARLEPDLAEYTGLNLEVGGDTVVFGACDRYLAQIHGILGREDCRTLFQAALELDRRTGSLLHEVETLGVFAAFLDGTGNPDDNALATEYRDRARSLAEGKNLVRQLRRLDAMTSLRSDRPAGLTPREIDVLRLVAEGMSNQEIADQLFISQNTAANHVRSILTKTQAANRTKAAIFAVRSGLID